jgi:hypothetical protein
MLDGLGVAPEQSAGAVGVGAVIGGGDVQRAGSGAGVQLGIKVPVRVGRVREVIANVLCVVSDTNGDVVIGQEPRAADDAVGRGDNGGPDRASTWRCAGVYWAGDQSWGAPIGS